jgi:hypothetical protein
MNAVKMGAAKPKLYRLAVWHWRVERYSFRCDGYWADSGCGELTLERAKTAWHAGRENRVLCKIVDAEAPILRAVP